MLRLLLESNTRGFQFRQGALVSLVAHSLLISASVLATREGPAAAIEEAQQKVIFLIPMNRTNSPPPREESVQFVREGEKAGTWRDGRQDRRQGRDARGAGRRNGQGGREAGGGGASRSSRTRSTTRSRPRSTSTRRSRGSRDSAAPMYPPKLLELKVEGGAYVQFVVDTMGMADTAVVPRDQHDAPGVRAVGPGGASRECDSIRRSCARGRCRSWSSSRSCSRSSTPADSSTANRSGGEDRS